MPNITGNSLGNIFTSTDTEDEFFFGLRGDDMLLFNGDLTDRFFGGRGDDTFVWNTRRLYEGDAPSALFDVIEFQGGRGIDTVEFRLEIATEVSSLRLSPFHDLFTGAEAAAVNLTFRAGSPQTAPRDFEISGSRFADGVQVQNRLGDNFHVNTKGGHDTVAIYLSDQTESLVIRTGKGNDTVRNTSGADGARIFTGPGQDSVTADGETSGTYHLGKGADRITFSYATRFAPDTVLTGGGRDVIEFTRLPTGLVSAKVLDFDPAKDRIKLSFDNFDRGIFFPWNAEDASQRDAVVTFASDNSAVFVNGSQFISFEQPVSLTEDNFLLA